MSTSKKYYYIKLKDNYFEQDNIKILESLPNGHIYSLILIKLYLKSTNYNGQLMMTPKIPYDPQKVEILASVIKHDVDHVREAIRIGCELDLITIVDGREIWMTDIQNMIGKSSTEADRIRNYRKQLQQGVQMYNKCTPEIEIELDIEKEIEKDKEPPSKPTKKQYLEFVYLTEDEYVKLCDIEGKSYADRFINKLNDYIGSKGKKYKSHYYTIRNWMRMEEDSKK